MNNNRFSLEELNRLQTEARKILEKIPGVEDVGFGIKLKEGKIVEQTAIHVFVKEKKKKKDVRQDEIIPDSLLGFLTDVIQVPKISNSACENKNKERPIVGGLMISNLKPKDPNSSSIDINFGTLGYFATLKNNSSKDNIAGFSNAHVLMSNNAKVKDPVFQPTFPTTQAEYQKESQGYNRIGNILDSELKGDYSFAYPNEPTDEYYIDCAIFKVNTDYSTCCDTNKGIEYKNEVKGLDIVLPNSTNSNSITNANRVAVTDIVDVDGNTKDYRVFKVGHITGKTEGRVISVSTPANANTSEGTPAGKNAIYIKFIKSYCDPTATVFSNKGDSGAVLVNANREIVGLLHGLDSGDPSFGLAGHIHPILHRFPISISTTPIPSPSGQRNLDLGTVRRSRIDEENVRDRLKKQFVSTEMGRIMLELFETHRPEVTRMVNGVRPVTITWHRNKGPAYVAHFVKNFHEPDHQIPLEIQGISLPQMLMAMRVAIYEQASQRLKKTIDQYSTEIIERTHNCRDLETLLLKLREVKQLN